MIHLFFYRQRILWHIRLIRQASVKHVMSQILLLISKEKEDLYPYIGILINKKFTRLEMCRF